jgi:hypothetical protein
VVYKVKKIVGWITEGQMVVQLSDPVSVDIESQHRRVARLWQTANLFVRPILGGA